ncbi:MAG TPA: NrtA/SsuA/CpmA family ABC transporter substrate-binding protein [Geobacteraceae bacterium]
MRSLLLRTAMAVVAALAIAACLFACTSEAEKPAGPPERVTIAYSATTDAVLAEVAQTLGYYLEEGLAVTPRLHHYGKPALEDLLAGKADFATAAETPIMFAIMKGAKISIIATIETSNRGNAVIARRDRGINNLGDLKGKRIAAIAGTTSDFYLNSLLAINGISRKDFEVVDLKVEELSGALERGEVDAISTFTPYTVHAQRRLGENGITFHDKEIYTWTFNLVATQEFIRMHPERVRKVLKALVRAEDFVEQNPAEAQRIVAAFSGEELEVVRGIWPDIRFRVSLDQALLLALEDESRWAMRAGLAPGKDIPNYLDFIYCDGLKSVKPQAVSILR